MTKNPSKSDISNRINVELTKKYGKPYNIDWSKLNKDAFGVLERLVGDASGYDEGNVPISDHINKMVTELTGKKCSGKWYRLDKDDLKFAEGLVAAVRDIKKGKLPDGDSKIDFGDMNLFEAAEAYLRSRKDKYKGRLRGLIDDVLG